MDRDEMINKVSASILLVEDDPNHRELIVEALKEAKVMNQLVWVEDGEEGLRYLKREGKYSDEKKYPKPDLILLDLRLPGMDGKDVLRHIKSDDRFREIPVVLLTSSALDKDIKECYKMGANSYIIKPLSFGDFIEKVKAIPLYWLLVNTLPSE